MKYLLCRLMYWLTAWDCDFARHSGRNPDHVAYLAAKRDEWSLLAWKAKYPLSGQS